MQPSTIGKYHIVEKIGAGAMGDVYKAHDPILNRFVAIKTISAELGADDTLRKRFEREAQSAARLAHPNIITVYDFGEEGDKLYMAMELLDGTDLKQVIKSGLLAGLEQKLGIMVQICEGLEFAHSHDIVHRDLKPANIHVLQNGQVKIMDFGLARLAGSEMTRTGTVLGTPNYMAPEQVRGERADKRSDIFAIGCVFYELVTAQKAFEAESMHAVLFRVMHDEPRPLSDVTPDVPLALAQVIEKMLAKDPAVRFQDAGELLAPLQQARQAVASGRGDQPLADLPAPRAREARSALADSVTSKPASSPPSRPGSGGRRVVVAPTPAPPPPRPAPVALYAIGGLVTLGLLVGVAVIALKPAAPPPAPPVTRPAQVDNLAKAVVDTQVELARKKLASGDTAEAARQAERALKLDPENAGAKEVLAAARKLLDAIAQAEANARAAGDDAEKASEAFWSLIQLAPDSPVAEELTAKLEAGLKGHARDAQKLMGDARQAAVRAGVGKTEQFADAEARAREAEEAAKQGRFASAARRYLAARDRFTQAARDLR